MADFDYCSLIPCSILLSFLCDCLLSVFFSHTETLGLEQCRFLHKPDCVVCITCICKLVALLRDHAERTNCQFHKKMRLCGAYLLFRSPRIRAFWQNGKPTLVGLKTEFRKMGSVMLFHSIWTYS